jgi:hypothetical protein
MGMTNPPNLHDGFFDGLWLSPDKRARLFVRTVTGELSTIVLTEVEALNVTSLRAGNIIFDVTLIAPENLTVKDIQQLYDLKDDQVEMARRLLSKAQQQGLSALEINPSYGAEGKVLFRTIDTFPEHVLT